MSKEIFFRRLEYLGSNNKNKAGQSDKFYEISVTSDGDYFIETRTWGKFGAKGQTKVISHYYAHSAMNSAKTQLIKKGRKGYGKPVGALIRLATVMDDE